MNENSTPSKSRGIRWWPIIVILALVAGNVYRLQSSPELDSNFKNMQTMMSYACGILLLLVWMMLFSRLRWRTRFICLGVFVVVIVGLSQSLRFDGSVNGTGLPKLAWKWTPKPDGNVGELKPGNAPASSATPVADYPGFLGSARNGMVENIRLVHDWTRYPPKELWRLKVGLGWSAFAVSGGKAITQEQRGEKELVVCYDLGTGAVIWSHTNMVRFSESLGGDGPRATPTIVEGRVYVLGGTGVLDCLDLATGKLFWTRDTLIGQGLPNTTFGKSSSPLVFDDLVVVTGGLTNEASLLAFKRADGSPAWHGGTDKAAYASPALVTLAGKRHIMTLNAASLSGQDTTNGKMLWKYDWGTDEWPKCTQPVVLPGDKVLISGSFGLGCVMLQVTAGADGAHSVKEIWKSRSMKSQYSTLVVKDGFLYGLDDGIMACVDLATGERKWKDGRYGHGQLLLAGDTILVQTEPGPVALVEASPTGLKELGRVGGLSQKTWNTPALAGEYLLIRNDQEAVCYKLALK